MSDVVNQTEYRVIGMSRSGNHTIINWLMSQIRGRVCFLNCAEAKTNPFLSARSLHHGRSYAVNYPGFDIESERQGQFSPKDYLIHSYEDCFLGSICHNLFERNHDRFVGRSRQRFDILILRDPFNLFASRLKSGYSGVPMATATRIWKQHAREYLGIREHLAYNKTLINYNIWATDRSYRRQIAGALGLEFTDAGFDRVAHCGGGSSFDGTDFDGRASAMGILERWKHFIDDLEYRCIFEPQMVALSHQIFGHIPGTEQVLELAC
jgi:hypothetical protein